MMGSIGESVVAASDSAESVGLGIGSVLGSLMIPLIGAALLIAGLIKRSTSKKAARRQQGPYPQQPVPQGPFPQQPFPQQGPQAYGQGYPSRQGPGNFPSQSGPGHQQAYGPVTAPPPKSTGKGLIVSGAIVLVVGLILSVGLLAVKVAGASGTLAVGDCITSESYRQTDLYADAVDCDGPEATFEVVDKVDADSTCPDGKLNDSAYAVLVNNRDALCFVPIVEKGACYKVDTDDNTFESAACTRTDGIVVRVDDVIEGSTDLSRCPTPEAGVHFPKPQRVICFGPPT